MTASQNNPGNLINAVGATPTPGSKNEVIAFRKKQVEDIWPKLHEQIVEELQHRYYEGGSVTVFLGIIITRLGLTIDRRLAPYIHEKLKSYYTLEAHGWELEINSNEEDDPFGSATFQ